MCFIYLDFIQPEAGDCSREVWPSISLADGSIIEGIIENFAYKSVHMLQTGGWERNICGGLGPSI